MTVLTYSKNVDLNHGRNVWAMAVTAHTVMPLYGVTVSYIKGYTQDGVGFPIFLPDGLTSILCVHCGQTWSVLFVLFVFLKQQSIYRLWLQRSHSIPRVWDSITQVPRTLALALKHLVCSRYVTCYSIIVLASEFFHVFLSSAFTLVLQQSSLMEPLAMWLNQVSRYRHMYSGQAQRPKTLIHRWSLQHDQSQWIVWLVSMVHHKDPRHPQSLGARSSLPRAGNNSWWNSSS